MSSPSRALSSPRGVWWKCLDKWNPSFIRRTFFCEIIHCFNNSIDLQEKTSTNTHNIHVQCPKRTITRYRWTTIVCDENDNGVNLNVKLGYGFQNSHSISPIFRIILSSFIFTKTMSINYKKQYAHTYWFRSKAYKYQTLHSNETFDVQNLKNYFNSIIFHRKSSVILFNS